MTTSNEHDKLYIMGDEQMLEERKAERVKELQPYIQFIREYDFLLKLDEDKYQAELREIEMVAEAHWAEERKLAMGKVDCPQEDTRTPEEIRNALIMEMESCRQAEAVNKARRTELEIQLAEDYFDRKKIKGSQSINLGAGWKLKCSKKLTYKVDTDQNKVMNAINQIPPEVFTQGERTLIKWKPELSESIYKTLTKEQTEIINEIITVKAGKPVVELVPPKEAK